MNLLFVRHAIAEKREEWNEIHLSDFFRPITKKGIVRFTDVALGISLFIPEVDHIMTSHYTRAVQTAEILHAQFPLAKLSYTKELNPESEVPLFVKHLIQTIESIEKKLAKLNQNTSNYTIAIIGHQPELTQIISMLLINKKDINLRLKKGGAALLSFNPKANSKKAELKWLMSGRQLVQFASVYEELKQIKA